ncbi:nucleotidyltransferase domain-containing protein [Nesterenkonia haasae]|uniref:nucleotidyltransferase domain-containing protein n=1 Tax=Nesterenkonia haasae TaxID=2587813 RepID=UPI001391890A|nr:nucleotidyltransferase [Nesterenkonia haasae]NDK30619.1 nucleotidyltransferase [Nesterenkonia haasae]
MTTISPTITLEQILKEARRRIEVSDDELDEARKRRTAIGAVLLQEFPGSRTYVNGSIAHGDALTPLTDVDLGIVVPDPDQQYRPGKRGPKDLKERAAEAIRAGLKQRYGDLAVEVKGRKRSILVRFRDPVAPGKPDFTADVIVAIDNPGGAGLYIPRFESWDRSHPENHTELIVAANKITDACFARVVRLLKHWNRSNSKSLCSWNIKALALGCIDTPTALIAGMREWFRYAIEELSRGETPDPAGVAANLIKLNDTRTEVVRRLKRSLEKLDRAISYERAGYMTLAHNELAKFFNDPEMLPAPSPLAVLEEEGRRVAAEKANDSKTFGAPALLTGTGPSAGRDRGNVRSWGA